MNNVYIYDSSQIHFYETEDFGSITDVAATTVDHGVKMFDYIVNVGDDFIVPVGQEYIVNEVTGSIDYEDVWITETTYPVSGNINFSGGEETSAAVSFVATAEPIVLRERAIVVRKQAWTGSGSLFEIGSGLERMVAPYIGGSGTLRVSGIANVSETNSYNLDAIITYSSDVDHGQILAAVGSSHDYGQVTEIVTEGETDNGTVVDLGGSNPFGLFSFTGFNSSLNRIKSYVGSGSLSIRSTGAEQFDEPVGSQTYIVGRDLATGQFIRKDVIGLRFHGGNPEAFARVGYQGSGVLFGLSGGQETKVYDYTTESAVTTGISEDYETINNTPTSTLDYGQVDGIVADGEFNNGSIVITQSTAAAQGVFNVLGTAQTARNRHQIGFGSISIAKHIDSYGEGQSSQIAFIPHYRSRGGIVVTNHVIPDAFSRPYTGSGSLFHIGEKVERAVFTYSVDPIVGRIYESVGSSDAGTVDQSAGTTEDYGTVTIPFTNGISDYGQLHLASFKFGNLNITGGDRAHANPRAYRGDGQLNTSGAATVQFNEPSSQVYIYGLLQNQTSKGEFFKIVGGMSSIITVKGTYHTSGGLFNSGEVDEATIRDYNDSSIVTVGDPINYGSVTNNATSTTDIGSLSESAYGETDFGQVAILQTTQPFGKLFEWSGGDIAHSNPRAYNGATAELRITGGYSNLKFTSQAGESTSLFKTTGGDRDSIIKVFTGAGSFFHIGDRVEKKTYSYNTSSIVDPDQHIEYGLVIHTASNHSDYGQIIHDFDASLSHSLGEVGGVIGDENPFGLYHFSGTAEEQYFPTFNWNRQSPPIKVFNDQQDPADFRFVPHWRSRHLVGVPKISNAPDGEFNTYARTRPFIASGRLFGLGDKFESATFRYTTESIVVVEQPEDYGLITSNPTQNLDHGAVNSTITPGGEFDNGQVVIAETTQSATGLFKFSGAAPKVQFLRGPYVVKPTAIRIFNEQQDPADFRFSPHWRSRPYEQGKLTGSAETPRARDFVGKGRLFGLGDKFESATFRYTTESIAVVEQPEDYGLITSNATQNLDFGDVASVITPDGEVDFGQVVLTQTTQSATGLYKFSGTSADQFFRGPYSGKGSITFYKGQSADTDFRFMPHWRGVPDEQFKVSGSAETPRARDFVGSGSLFHIGEKIEKKVYNYTTESIEVVQPSDDWGSITTSGGTLDYGDVGSAITPGGEFDFGQVVITHTTQPFGLFRFRGGGHGAIRTIIGVATTAEINISGNAIEKFGSQAGESTVLFRTAGGDSNKAVKSYVGEGSLFHIGEKVEKVVFNYTTSSIGESFGSEDRGNITNAPTTNVNYGLIENEYLTPTFDYGLTLSVPGSERPFGQLFEIKGGDSGHRQTFAEFSSGSLFGTDGAAEAFIAQTPEETFLLKMRGGAIEKHVENYVGSGLIKYPEDTPLAPNAAVRFRPHWRSRHLLGVPRILGNTEVAFKGAYVSKGVFFRMYTHDKGEEWLRYRPSPRYVNSIYGQIGGSAFVNGDGATRKINVYGYYGDDRDPGTSGSLFGFGGGAESRGITPPLEDTVILRFGGTSPSKWNPAWTSRPDGSPRLFGTPELQLRFNIFTNPEGESVKVYGDALPVRTIVYDGSGTLFTAGSSAEVVGFNPEVETRAFTFTGTPVVRIRVILFGGGAMFGFGSGAESTTIAVPESTTLFVPSGTAEPIIRTQVHQGSGTEFITGNSINIRSRSHVGSGSLFSAGGLSEAVAVNEAESTALFTASGGDRNTFTRSIVAEGSATINGIGNEASTRPYFGEGSLFSIGGASESAGVAEESTGLFEFTGSAEPIIRTRGFIGSGSLFAVGNSAEVSVVAPDATGLFIINGQAQAPFTRTKIGSGTTFVSGSSENASTRIYTGEGQLSTFGGGAEIVGFNPAEETFLYEFNGNATATRTRGFSGSGTATVLNEHVVPIISLSFVGDGSLTTFGGAAESRTIDVENTTLFEFRNGATESFTKGNYDGEGSATISGEVSDIKITRSENVFAYVSVTGDSHDSRSRSHVGSGLFSTFSGAVESRTIAKPLETTLFAFRGENPGSVTRITQPTIAEFRIEGESISKVILFSPPRTFSTII